MAESVLFNSAKNILETLASLAVQEFCLAWGLESDLRRLETSVFCISALLLEADEEQKATDRKISIWLRRLRDVLYEAEDVLDDFAYQVLRNKVVSTRGSINRKVRRFFSSSNSMAYRLGIGHKIKTIRQTLDEIAADKAQFNLSDRLVRTQVRVRTTHSYNDPSDVIGRVEDIETIVEFLVNYRDDNENISVIPIVGIGGIGKTTLAKIIFNDKRVDEHFDMNVWVCLNDMREFDDYQVMLKIVLAISDEKLEGIIDRSNSEKLQVALRNNLRDKVFLLVLNNMWDVNRTKWFKLKALLAGGAKGSKIVVTTRMSSIASCVGTVCSHSLKGISHEACVSLFKKFAFSCGNEVDQSLMGIGDEIVRKCKGVPLAVKALGSSLFSKSEYDWVLVRDSAIWQIEEGNNEILNALRLSYNQLPSHLKLCFLYCSIFPKHYIFQDLWLISFWMAHGLLHSRKYGNPQQVGKQYIQDLLSTGFFEDFKEHSWYCSFKMHDLMHNLAISLGQEEFATIDASNKTISEHSRHVCFEVQSFTSNSSNAIRTALVPNEAFGAEFSAACISKFKLLRVLCLANSVFEELPNSVGTLKHLRSFDLRGCRRLKRLPKSICKLHYLETLLLTGCIELEESVPMSAGELVYLRWLWITTKQKHLAKSLEIFSSLQFLAFSGCRNLEIFFDGKKKVHLTSLQTLIVQDCQSLTSLFPRCSDSVSGIIYDLPALEVLYVRDCKTLDLHKQEHYGLNLPLLRSLTIQGLAFMEDLPQWIEECAKTLQYLKIKDCENLTALPEWLHNLKYLQTLKIISCPKLLSLPREMNRIKELEIKDCGVLSESCSHVVSNSLSG